MKCCDECLIKTCNLKGGTITCLAYMQELKENNLDLKINFNNSEKREEKMKEIYIILDDIKQYKHYPDIKITHFESEEYCGDTLYTTELTFADFNKADIIYFVYHGNKFPIIEGLELKSGKELKRSHNLVKLLLAGEFDKYLYMH